MLGIVETDAEDVLAWPRYGGKQLDIGKGECGARNRPAPQQLACQLHRVRPHVDKIEHGGGQRRSRACRKPFQIDHLPLVQGAQAGGSVDRSAIGDEAHGFS